MIKSISLSIVFFLILVENVYSQGIGFLAGSSVVSCAEVDVPYGVNAMCLPGATYSWTITGASSYVFTSGGRGVNIKWPNNSSPKKVSVNFSGTCGSETYTMDVTLHNIIPLPVAGPSILTPTTTKLCAGASVPLEAAMSSDPNADSDPLNDIRYVWSYSKDGASPVSMPTTSTNTTNFTLPAFSTGGSIVFYVHTYNNTCSNFVTSQIQSAPQTVLTPAPSAPDLRACLDGSLGTLSLISVPGGGAGEQYFINVENKGGFGPFQAGDAIGEISSYAETAYQFYRYAERPSGGTNGCAASGNTPASNAYSITAGGTPNCASGLEASVSGGTSPYSYKVNTGAYQPGTTFNSLTPGSFTVRAKDKYGCIGVSSAVTVFPIVSHTVTPKLACPGISDGSITINATGGEGPFEYSIDNGSTVSAGNVFSGLAANTYSIYAKDNNGAGCVTTASFPLANSPALNITSVIPTAPLCAGAPTGSLDVSANGGTGAFQYTIGSDYQDESTFTGLLADTYTVTVKDGNNCTKAFTPVPVTDPPAIVFTLVAAEPRSCEEKTDGVVKVQASGGTGAREYSIDGVDYFPEDSPNIFGGLPSDVYTVYVLDGNGCPKTATTPFVGVLPAIAGPITEEEPISCHGEDDGVLKIVPTGGTTPYTILWSNGIPPAQLNPDLGPGDYSVDILDAKGCTKTFSKTLIEPGILEVDPVISNHSGYGVRCAGDIDGSIDLTITGGTGPFEYTWSNGDDIEDVNNLPPGEYDVTVVDGHGCNAVLTNLSITEPSAVGISKIQQKNISCNSGVDGEIEIGASGGVGLYEFSLDGVNWDESVFTGLNAGDYILYTRDANLCTRTMSATLTEPSLLALTISGQVDTSCGESNGSAAVTASGGVLSYRYEWRDAGNALISETDQAAALRSGDYRAYVYDGNNCPADILITVNDSDGPKVQQLSLTGLTCNQSNDGAISVDITEGQTPYTITWDTQAQGVTSVSNVTGGEHWVEVFDANGCRTKRFFQVDFPPALDLTFTASDPVCKGNSDGHIEISVTGGNPGGYEYEWTTGGNETSVEGLPAGTYGVTVKDSKLCTLQKDILLTEPPLFVIDAGGDRTICVGQVLNVTAPEDNATYEWTSDAGFSSIEQEVSLSVPARYTLKIINLNGCIAEDSFMLLTSNDLLRADFLSAHEAHAGDTVVLIDISWPVPERISWNLPAGSTIVRQDDAYAEVVFANSGVYNITLNTFLGECIDEYGKSITILGERPDSGGRKGSKTIDSFEIHPNPNDGRFTVSIALGEIVPARLMMVNVSGNKSFVVSFDDEKSEIIYNAVVENAPAGIYFLILEAGHEKQIKRLIIR